MTRRLTARKPRLSPDGRWILAMLGMSLVMSILAGIGAVTVTAWVIGQVTG